MRISCVRNRNTIPTSSIVHAPSGNLKLLNPTEKVTFNSWLTFEESDQKKIKAVEPNEEELELKNHLE